MKILNTPKVLVFVSHSLGEFDTLFPFFGRITTTKPVKVIIVVTVKKIYEQYLESKFLQHCAHELSIDVILHRLPNKFDDRYFLLPKSRVVRLTDYVYQKTYGTIKVLYLWKELLSSCIYMHEISNQLLTTHLFYKLQRILRKTIVTYHHGPGVIKTINVKKKIPFSRVVLHLSYHEHNRNSLYEMGFVNQYEIGYPQFYPEWRELVISYFAKNQGESRYALILTRGVHDYYMDKQNYIYLLETSIKLIREKFGSIPILIKPHPREDKKSLVNILRRNKLDGWELTDEHPSVLGKNAKVAVVFFSSTVFNILAWGTPTVEYNIEAKRFRELEKEGSPYKNLGIDSAKNKEELAVFFAKVLEKSYIVPTVVEQLKINKHISLENIIQSRSR